MSGGMDYLKQPVSRMVSGRGPGDSKRTTEREGLICAYLTMSKLLKKSGGTPVLATITIPSNQVECLR